MAPTKPKRRIPQTFISSSTAILIHKTPLQLLPSSFAPFWVEFTDRRMAEVRASEGFHGGGMARVLIPDSLDSRHLIQSWCQVNLFIPKIKCLPP